MAATRPGSARSVGDAAGHPGHDVIELGTGRIGTDWPWRNAGRARHCRADWPSAPRTRRRSAPRPTAGSSCGARPGWARRGCRRPAAAAARRCPRPRPRLRPARPAGPRSPSRPGRVQRSSLTRIGRGAGQAGVQRGPRRRGAVAPQPHDLGGQRRRGADGQRRAVGQRDDLGVPRGVEAAGRLGLDDDGRRADGPSPGRPPCRHQAVGPAPGRARGAASRPATAGRRRPTTARSRRRRRPAARPARRRRRRGGAMKTSPASRPRSLAQPST